MKALIKLKLEKVITGLEHDAAKAGRLCACKALTYADRQSPDYANPLIQQS